MLIALWMIKVTEVDVADELDWFAYRNLFFPSTLRKLLLRSLLAHSQRTFTTLFESFLEVQNEVSVLAVGFQMRQILVVVERDALVEPECDEYGMADLEADILCWEVVFKPIYVVLDLDHLCLHLLVRLVRIVLIYNYLGLSLVNV